MTLQEKPRILCVDDEPRVLEGLELHLRKRFDVWLAPSGPAGLEILRASPEVAVVISDMRMPEMNGATFLAKAREIAPDAVRILLTGHADIESAIAAINEGHIFRFLCKPCPPPVLLGAALAGLEQHRLVTAERVLLEQTLRGSIEALTDVLALTSPLAFGRASRAKDLASQLATKLGVRDRWRVEVAAMLSQLGTVTLPGETLEKIARGSDLSSQEQTMASGIPAATQRVLAHIPRLEAVRAILAGAERSFGPEHQPGALPDPDVHRAGQILRVALAFDAHVERGAAPCLAVTMIQSRGDAYDPAVVQALGEVCELDEARLSIRAIALPALKVGMRLAEDVMLKNGTLLAPRGYVVTPSFVARAGNFAPGTVKEPIVVSLVAEEVGAPIEG